MKVSRVVLIVVALHVLVIGGIFIFEGCSRATKGPAPDMAENESPGDQSAANAPALPPDTAAQNNLVPAAPTTPAPTAVTTAAASTTPPAARSYVVKKGDSLWKIAKSQGVSVGDLARANNLTKTSALKVGQKLQIPSAAKSEPAITAAASVVPTTTPDASAAAATTASASDGQIYTVKSGDSLWKIARQQNVSVASIKQANNLSSDSLKVGQKLHLPSQTATTAATTTASATPSAPAASAGIATSPYAEWREPGTYTENGQTIHVVDIGESPAIIAKKYGVKVDDLMKANGISDARRIVVGQKLVIPTQSPATPATTSAAPATAIAAPIVSEKQASMAN